MKYVMLFLFCLFSISCFRFSNSVKVSERKVVGECKYRDLQDVKYNYYGDSYKELNNFLLRSDSLSFIGENNLKIFGINIKASNYELLTKFCFSRMILDSVSLSEDALIKFDLFVVEDVPIEVKDSLLSGIYRESKFLSNACEQYSNDAVWKTLMVSGGVIQKTKNTYWLNCDDSTGEQIILINEDLFIFRPKINYPKKRYLYDVYYGWYPDKSYSTSIVFLDGTDTIHIVLDEFKHPSEVVKDYEND